MCWSLLVRLFLLFFVSVFVSACGSSEPAETSTPREGSSPPSEVDVQSPTTEQESRTPAAAAEAPTYVQDPQKGHQRNELATPFTFTAISGAEGQVSLSDYIGPNATQPRKGVILTFGASWCSRCRAALPTMIQLQEEYEGTIQFLYVDTDRDPAGVMAETQHFEELGNPFPLLQPDWDLVGTYLGARRSIPRFYLIDQWGRIRAVDRGFGNRMRQILPRQTRWLAERAEPWVPPEERPEEPAEAGANQDTPEQPQGG